jgi:hypothetical protein
VRVERIGVIVDAMGVDAIEMRCGFAFLMSASGEEVSIDGSWRAERAEERLCLQQVRGRGRGRPLVDGFGPGGVNARTGRCLVTGLVMAICDERRISSGGHGE